MAKRDTGPHQRGFDAFGAGGLWSRGEAEGGRGAGSRGGPKWGEGLGAERRLTDEVGDHKQLATVVSLQAPQMSNAVEGQQMALWSQGH